MSSSPLHQQRNHHNSNNPYLPPWMSPRQRTFAVILLCGMTMVGCFVRFGSLPREESGEGLLLANHNSRDTTKHQTTKNDWWADDDETAFTGDDDFYNKKEKRVRGGQKKNTNNNTKGAYNNIDNDATEQKPKKPSKQLPVLPTASDAKDKTSISVSSPQPILDNHKKSRPGIVWLMSYPNSGTSYTMTAVAKATNRATASNYGREVTDPPETNVPLYPGQWDGPFYRPDPKRPLPEDYIMVKTHCGGRCVACGPDEYLLNETDFLDECRRGAGLFPERRRKMEGTSSSDLPDGFELVHYDADLVQKAIHLIRNPFHNIVSRFHLERKHWVSRDKTAELERFTNDAAGFHVWCSDLNNNFGPTLKTGGKMPSTTSKNDAEMSISRDVMKLMQDVPCHGEIYKYVQWHNHANAVMTNYLKKPTMVIHYENYDKLWNKTATKIFDFLHLDMTGSKKQFHARHDYDPYFSPSQQKAARKLIERLARPAVWHQLERYFPDN